MFLSKVKQYRQKKDEDLLSIYREKQSRLIIGVLYERYGHLVMGSAMKYLKNEMDAQDITMTLFEELPKKILAHDISFFKSWLYQVTRNACLMKLRAEKGKGSIEFDTEMHSIGENVSETELNEIDLKESQYQLIESALKNLKPDQKKCIELFYLKGKSYQEISDQLGIAVLKVKSAIQNGKRNLRIQLEEQDEFKKDI